MPVITPITPGEPFDPITDLLNPRYAQIEAELTRQRQRNENGVWATLDKVGPAGLDWFSLGAIYRIGNTVTFQYSIMATIANFLCTETRRQFSTIPDGFRPRSTDMFDVASCFTPAAPTTQRTAEIAITGTNRNVLSLSRYSQASHDVNTVAKGFITYLTNDPWPAS